MRYVSNNMYICNVKRQPFHSFHFDSFYIHFFDSLRGIQVPQGFSDRQRDCRENSTVGSRGSLTRGTSQNRSILFVARDVTSPMGYRYPWKKRGEKPCERLTRTRTRASSTIPKRLLVLKRKRSYLRQGMAVLAFSVKLSDNSWIIRIAQSELH